MKKAFDGFFSKFAMAEKNKSLSLTHNKHFQNELQKEKKKIQKILRLEQYGRWNMYLTGISEGKETPEKRNM